MPPATNQRGIALVITLLAISFFSALALGLALSSSVERLAAANHEEAVWLFNAADAALELAARDLAGLEDWDAVLAGVLRSPLVDGLPDGIRQPSPGIILDLTRATNDLTCGDPAACSDAAVHRSTTERPWGWNNPRWRAFLYTPLEAATTPRQRTAPYVVVWIGDDASEVDGDPLTDGGGEGREGRYSVRAHAEAFGPRGARRAIEADLSRICTAADGEESCLPGIRVHSWRLVTAGVP